jgi:tRNA (mo5U34)-methyltransferase
MEVEELKKEVAKIEWWHYIDLGNGIITPGRGDNFKMLPALDLPDDLTGKTVLDVGAWDGFFSFEAEKRNAARVLATDSFSWYGEGWGTKAGFEFARKVLNSKVEDMDIDVLELSPEKVGTFDLVLCLGVLYHMRHPLLALEHVYSVTGDQLILETQVDMLGYRRPAMAFYPGSESHGDPTNWVGPNPKCVVAMLETVGFRKIKVFPKKRSFPEKIGKTAQIAIRHVLQREQKARYVFHAWR